jgi:PAS domain S-box-containing protein
MTLGELRQERAFPVVVADERGVITYVNEPFERVFGWGAAEIVGRPLTRIIPPTLHDAHHLGFSRFIMTGTATLLNQPLALTAVTRQGKEFDAQHTIVAERQDGRWVFGAMIAPLGPV